MKFLNLSFVFLFLSTSLFAQGTETFTNIKTGSSSYAAQTWTGDNGLQWSASKARTDLTINGPAITLDGRTTTEKLECSGIPGGIGSLTFSHIQAFTGSGGLLTVKINGNQVGTDIPISTTQGTATLPDINIAGDFTLTIEVKTVRVSIDDVTWTATGGEPKPEPDSHPASFSGSSLFSTSLTLNWVDATGIVIPDGYLVKGSVSGFDGISDPVDGDSEPVTGLIKVVGHGVQTLSYSGLTPVTTYYFKIYPFTNSGSNINYKVDGAVQQVSVTTLEGSSLKPEPSGYPTLFSAPDPGQTNFSVTWSDATGETIPDGYLIKGSNSGFNAISAPVDGVIEASTGFTRDIPASVENAIFSGLSSSTTYYFKIYPYSNSGSDINYKTDGSVPQVSVTTLSSGGGTGIPVGYYTAATGTGATLKSNLYGIIKGHTSVSYGSLYSYFVSTDSRPDGKIWDMYSNVSWTHGSKQCGSYSKEGDCYNREHSFPASWFNDASPMYSDLYHLYPTDGYVNNRRSNYPFGEVKSPSYTSQNGSKVGSNSFPGYSGTVFEPLDEYKGDFARTSFYMVTRYENIVSNWQKNNASSDAVLSGNTFPAFEQWYLNMMWKWHHQDPVSQKEIDRNNAVYAIQKNRNPYIDHPEYADLVWGGVAVSVEAADLQLANQIEILSTYPNPFNPEMKVKLNSGKAEPATIRISNVLGQVVYEETVNLSAGVNEWNWSVNSNAGAMPASGVYYLTVTASSGVATRPVVLLK